MAEASRDRYQTALTAAGYGEISTQIERADRAGDGVPRVGLGPGAAGTWLRVEVDGEPVAEAKASSNGKLRFKANSPEGKAIVAADRAGSEIRAVATG